MSEDVKNNNNAGRKAFSDDDLLTSDGLIIRGVKFESRLDVREKNSCDLFSQIVSRRIFGRALFLLFSLGYNGAHALCLRRVFLC